MTIMQKISQDDLEANLRAQAQGEGCDLSNADLSAILWDGLNLGGTTIALSLIRDAHFSAGQALNGCCWIGNTIENCVFASISISKSELLDCEFNGCTIDAMQFFRADLSRTLFSSCRFVDVDFSQTSMIQVRFENCVFVRTRLTKDFLFTGTGDFVFSAGDPVSPRS